MIDNGMVVALGLLIVFIGLIAVIAIISIMGAIMKKAGGKNVQAAAAPAAPAQAPAAAEIPNKGEFIAAVSAAIAEDTGTDITRIRIHKIEKAR